VLLDVAIAALDTQSNGGSYEPFGWYSAGDWADGTVMGGKQAGGFNEQMGITNPQDPRYKVGVADLHPNDDPTSPIGVVKRFGKLKHPTKTILITDVDRDPPTPKTFNDPLNNWPDPKNNHGIDGSNFGFGDGHVEFVKRGPGFIRAFIDGYQGLAQKQSFSIKHCPGLSISNRGIGGESFKVYRFTK
jgi:prepilin-type processing-associated H-X9-DG protein